MESELSLKIQEKVQLLNKKVQDRKTQEIFEDEKITYDEISKILELSEVQQQRTENSEVIISILATMKSIAHTIQSKSRWDNFIEDRKKKGHEVFTLSSKGDFNNIHQVNESMSRPCPPRHIVICSHIKRMNDLVELVKYIEECSSSWKQSRKLRIYLDEFDKYITSMRSNVEELVMSDVVSKITIVTATPHKIWSTGCGWEKIFVLNPRIVGDGDSYLMFKDCIHLNIDDEVVELPTRSWMEIGGYGSKENKELIDYHHKIVMMHPDTIIPGNVIFAPGNISRKSHDLVRQFWNTGYKCSVAIVNGERTMKGYYGTLYIKNGQVFDIPHMRYKELVSKEMKDYVLSQPGGTLDDRHAQLNEVIADIYHFHQLSKAPFVITGRLCVERAQTLVHPCWGTFTHAVYFKATSPDDAYQQQRQLGHVKKWTTYRGSPFVFSPQNFRQDVQILENRADQFSTEYGNSYAGVFDYISSGGGMLTSSEIKQKNHESRKLTKASIKCDLLPYNTIDEVNEFLKQTFGVKRGVQPFKKHGGFEINHRLKAWYKKSVQDLVPEDRLTEEKFKRIPVGMNIASHDKKGQHYMVYPVYPTMTSSPSEVVYHVRYLPLK